MGVSGASFIILDKGTKAHKKITASSIAGWGSLSCAQKAVRTVALPDPEIVGGYIKSVTDNGICPAVAVETEDAYRIVCTPDTLFLNCDNGKFNWKRADALTSGSTVMSNGIPDERYKDPDWLKRVYSKEKKTQRQIAEICKVSPRTVRFYVKAYGLGRGDSGALFGASNPNYSSETESSDCTDDMPVPQRTGICSLCGAIGTTQLHSTKSGFVEVCPLCHKTIHLGYTVRHIRKSIVSSVSQTDSERMFSFVTSNGTLVIDGFIIGCGEDNDGC